LGRATRGDLRCGQGARHTNRLPLARLVAQVDALAHRRTGEIERGLALVAHAGVAADHPVRTVRQRQCDRAPCGAGTEVDDDRAAAGQGQELGQLGRPDGGDQAEAVAGAACGLVRAPAEAGHPNGQHA
jgi:hypothetical protein